MQEAVEYMRICEHCGFRMYRSRWSICGFASITGSACTRSGGEHANLRALWVPHVQELGRYMRICESSGFRMYKWWRSTCDLAGLTVCACASGGGVHAFWGVRRFAHVQEAVEYMRIYEHCVFRMYKKQWRACGFASQAGSACTRAGEIHADLRALWVPHVQEAVEYMRLSGSDGLRMCKWWRSTCDLASKAICACTSGGGVHASWGVRRFAHVQEAVEYMRLREFGVFRMCKKRWSTCGFASQAVSACASGDGAYAYDGLTKTNQICYN